MSSEIGRERAARTARRFAIAALAFWCSTTAATPCCTRGRWPCSTRACTRAARRIRVAAFPDPVNPWRFRGLVETREFVSLHDMNVRADFDPNAGRIFYKPEPSPALEAAARTATFRDFLRFAQYPFWRVQPAAEPEGGLHRGGHGPALRRPAGTRFCGRPPL